MAEGWVPEQVWAPHAVDIFVPAALVKHEKTQSVYRTDQGEQIILKSGSNPEKISDASDLAGVNDVCSLASVSDASLLHTVRVRYKRDEIYTNISRILIALNPYKPLPVYSAEHLSTYRYSQDGAELPPHIFGVGADACQKLMSEQTGQAVLVSGESGSGKTESTKLVLLYLSEVLVSEEDGLADRLLEINPILEAFGNAKTSRNNNSSRFGKWIEIHVDPLTMELVKTSVTDYLLEVTRICSQGPDERNFHIFYSLLLEFGNSAEDFAFLKRNPAKCPGVDDMDNMVQLKKAFKSLDFSEEEQQGVYQTTIGVLHLGQIDFTATTSDGLAATELVNNGALDAVADKLGLDRGKLEKSICFKRRVIGGEVSESPLDNVKASQARDSIAKMIYSRLFKWLIARCNAALDHQGEVEPSQVSFIGLLDIAGFESFESNNLEQLCINLSNEKLQQFFNSTVFRSELAAYAAEGVKLETIPFKDNADVIALLEGKGGLLQLLDDACSNVKTSDATFTTAVIKAHEKHPNFIKPKFANQEFFGVLHYAGAVTYTTTGFLEKNAFREPPEVLELMQTSSSHLMKVLSGPKYGESAEVDTKKSLQKHTVSSAFRRSLGSLIDKLSTAQAHFVKCIKPNKKKKPGEFDARMVLDQLTLSGVMEAVKIRQAGYPVRKDFNSFVQRYYIILPKSMRNILWPETRTRQRSVSNFDEVESLDATKKLLELMPPLLPVSDSLEGAYAIGVKRIFMKDSLVKVLEHCRSIALQEPIKRAQALFRGWHTRKLMRETKEIYKQLQELVNRIDGQGTPDNATVAELDLLMICATKAKFKLPVLERARQIRSNIKAEVDLGKQLHDLGSIHDVTVLQVLSARSASLGLDSQQLLVLTAQLEKVKTQHRHVSVLRECETAPLEKVRKTMREVQDAGLGEPDAWVLPEGKKLLVAGLGRLSVLEKEWEEQEAARKAEEERLRKIEETLRLEEEQKRKEEEERLEREREQERLRLEAEAAARAKRIADEIAQLQVQIKQAAAELDAETLMKCFSKTSELGMPESDCSAEHECLLNLQRRDFVEEQLAKLRRKGGRMAAFKLESSKEDLLRCNNLMKQSEVLGATELKEVGNEIRKSLSCRRKSVLDSEDPVLKQLGETCFDSLDNFSRLNKSVRTPVARLKKAARKQTVTSIKIKVEEDPSSVRLQYEKGRITEPLTEMDALLSRAALQNNVNVLRCMGDKPSPVPTDLQSAVINMAQSSPELTDETYLQVMKQLTNNPSVESMTKGWKLMVRMCSVLLPSEDLVDFVHAFLKKNCKAESEEGEESTQGVKKRRALSTWGGQQDFQRSEAFAKMAVGDMVGDMAQKGLDALIALRSAGNDDERNDPTQGMAEVIVKTPDARIRRFYTKPTDRLAVVYQKMLEALSVKNGVYFSFFAESNDRAPRQLLPCTMTVGAAHAVAACNGDKFLFWRNSFRRSEVLPLDERPETAKLVYLCAKERYLNYALPMREGLADGILPLIGAALLMVDAALYSKPRRGDKQDKFNAKVESLRQDIEGGLFAEGVLERYVPVAHLPRHRRKRWGEKILDVYKSAEFAVNSAGSDQSFVLLCQNRALGLMTEYVPDFEAFTWDPVSQVPLSMIKRYDKELCMGDADLDTKSRLFVSNSGVEFRGLRSEQPILRLLFREGGCQQLVKWEMINSELILLTASAREDGNGEEVGLINVPSNTPTVICAMMSQYQSLEQRR